MHRISQKFTGHSRRNLYLFERVREFLHAFCILILQGGKGIPVSGKPESVFGRYRKNTTMKTKNLLFIIAVLALCVNANAQILKKLSQKVEKAMDGILGPESSDADQQNDGGPGSPWGGKDYNTAKNVNTENKRAFYTHDVVIHTVNEKNEITNSFFDADELALRAKSSTLENPIYTDSEGYQYAYNDHEARWEKTGIMRSDAMSFGIPAMSASTLNLPQEPMLDATAEFRDKGMNLSTFLMVEWVFVYTPDDFRSDDYTEKQEPCETGISCPTFYHQDPEYKGTYVQFDNEGRLSKIIAHANSQYVQGAGSFEFDYDTPVSVSIPPATEVKMPFQDILFEGLNVHDK